MPATAAAVGASMQVSLLRPGDWCSGRIRVLRTLDNTTTGFLYATETYVNDRVSVCMIPDGANYFHFIMSDNPTRIGILVCQ